MRVFRVEFLTLSVDLDFVFAVEGLARDLSRFWGGEVSFSFPRYDIKSEIGRLEGRTMTGGAGGDDASVDGGEEGGYTSDLKLLRFREL